MTEQAEYPIPEDLKGFYYSPLMLDPLSTNALIERIAALTAKVAELEAQPHIRWKTWAARDTQMQERVKELEAELAEARKPVTDEEAHSLRLNSVPEWCINLINPLITRRAARAPQPAQPKGEE